MSAVLAIATVELRRFLRDRSNIFFVFIFPLLLVLVLGLQFGENAGQARVSISGADTALREAVVAELEDDDAEVTITDADSAREQLARGRADVGVFISATAAADFANGADVRLDVVTGTQGRSQAAYQQVRSAVQTVATRAGQLAALEGAGVDPGRARAALADARDTVAGPSVEVVDLDEVAQEFSGVGQFDVNASQQVLLFVFLVSLAGSATLIQARRLKVLSRTLAAPVSTGQAIAGQAIGRFVVALTQGAYIMAGTAVLFGVDWGNLGLSVLVLAVFCVVAAAAAMVIGSVMDNDSAASGVGVGAGLVLAALGGSMLPLELFPDTLRTVANLTPHAWGYRAFAEIQRHDAGLVDILPALGVLAAMAAVLLLAGSWLLRRSLERAI